MIETRLLRNALALNEYRNFARAAQALHITQPTLTRSIQALEKQVGTRLFDRRARTVLPTPVGRELLKHARLVVASTQALQGCIKQFQGLEKGALLLGIGPYAASILLGQAISRFNSLYPAIRITAMVDDWVNLPRRLKQGEFDFILMETTHLQAGDELDVQPLLPHQGFFYCDRTHPLLDRETLSLSDLGDYPLAVPSLPQRLLDLFCQLFRAQDGGCDPAEHLSLIQSNDVSLLRNTVANGRAIGIATYGMLKQELDSGHFVALPFNIPRLQTAYGIVTRRNLSLSPAALAFADILREINAEQCVLDESFASALEGQRAARR